MNTKTNNIWKEKRISEICIEIPEQEINIVKPEKQPDLKLCQIIRLYFREYCMNSSLHGIRYLGEKGRTKTERVLWFLFFITSIFLCSQLINKSWNKWDSMPVIISAAERPTPIWQVPFPAVTICSETKIRQTKYNYTDYLLKIGNENLTKEEEKQFSDVSLLCDMQLYMGQNITDQSAIDFIDDIAPDDVVMQCKYFNNNCKHLFSKHLTEEGICYSFNMLDKKEIFNKEAADSVPSSFNFNDIIYEISHEPSEWSLDKGYKKGSDMIVYPNRAFPGKPSGLKLWLKDNKKDFDYSCRGLNQGFNIYLHSPDEIPRIEHQYIKASWDKKVSIKVEPNIMTTSEGLKNYHPSRRNCYFPSEKKLRYFKIYAQENCEMECFTNFTLSKCECVAFYMPRAKDTAICGSGRIQCIFDSIDEFILRDLRNEFNNSDHEDKHITSPNCNCLPGCSSLAYNAETTIEEFNWKKIDGGSLDDLYKDTQISRVEIFFKEPQYTTRRRSELYDQTDFLAACGGLLGLFMGFSFLSLIEIAYFLTLRFFCNIEMHVKRLWNAIKVDSLRG